MPPRKRRVAPGDREHRGRVTLPRDPTAIPRTVEPGLAGRPKHHEREPVTPSPSSRYTPRRKSVRFRPGWHKGVGAGIVGLGVAIAILNDAMLFSSTTLLPGGHSEFYLMLAVAIAAYATWWFGWFDREK